MLIAYGCHRLAEKEAWQGWRVLLPALPRFMFLTALFLFVSIEMKAQEELIEHGNRERIGRFLKKEMKPGDRVYLECIGYIGYFSGAKVLDYPGLVSDEVCQLTRKKENFTSVIPLLKPEWMVLRFQEFGALMVAHKKFMEQNYNLAGIFDVRKKVEAEKLRFGEDYLYFDALFLVLKRITPKDEAPATAR